MKIKISKSQWEETGRKAGWIKKDAQGFGMANFDDLELGTTPSGEDCAQVGATKYDYYELARMELQAFLNQLKRMFPNPPPDVRFKRQSNPHDFGTYYDLAIRYNSNDEEAVNYAMNIENNLPENWDEQAKRELEEQGYFQKLMA